MFIIILSMIDLANNLFSNIIGLFPYVVGNATFLLGRRPFLLGGFFSQMESANQIGILVPHDRSTTGGLAAQSRYVLTIYVLT